MVCDTCCSLIFLDHAINADDLLSVGEIDNVRLVIFVMKRVFLTHRLNCTVRLFDFKVTNDIVVPDQDGDDSLTYLHMHVVAVAFLTAHIVLVESLVVISQDSCLTAVESV